VVISAPIGRIDGGLAKADRRGAYSAALTK
jgi:hypothetical protein